MKISKRFLLTALASMIATGSVFASGTTQSGGGSAAQQKLTIKVGDNWGPSHPMAAALDTVFKPQIEQASGDAFTWTVTTLAPWEMRLISGTASATELLKLPSLVRP